EGHLAPDEVLVEIGVGVGGAVGGNEQVGALEVGGVHWGQLDLYRPLAQLGGRGSGGGGVCLGSEGAGLAAGAGAGGGFGGHIGLHRRLVIGGGLSLHEGDGPGGAGGQAVPQAVAVVVPDELGLAVYHGDGP